MSLSIYPSTPSYPQSPTSGHPIDPLKTQRQTPKDQFVSWICDEYWGGRAESGTKKINGYDKTRWIQ